ncbi:MAG: hypothetical protein B7Z51_03855, partial [Methyloversatilis sp. 12-65-5]
MRSALLRCLLSVLWLTPPLSAQPLPAQPSSLAAASHAEEHEQTVVRDAALTFSDALSAALGRAPGTQLPQARLSESRVLTDRAGSVLSAPPALHMRYQT